MKFLAFLKDSWRETIDSKVFFVVMAISLLAVLVVATLSVEPHSPTDALQKITDRFFDGSREVKIPVLGKVKISPAFTQYSVQDLKGPENNTKPWEAEYQFVIESRDKTRLGGRIAVLVDQWMTEEEKERTEPTGKKTRGRQIDEEMREEARSIQERELKKNRDRVETEKNIVEQFQAYMARRLEEEVRAVSTEDMEQFVKEQLENQGNWRVLEVKAIDLPPEERKIKLKTQVPIQEGEDVRLKMEEVEGEVNKFNVKVVSKSGTYRVWPHKASMFFGGIPMGDSVKLGDLVYNISHYAVGWIGAPVIMLLSCILTAFYIPNMLGKGMIDLLLAKPMSRVSLLVYKYVGGLTFMFVNTTLLVVGLWVVLGLRSGIWEPSFLYMIPILTFEFALFYALSTLAAVLTRSPIVCILVCVLMWGILTGIGWAYWLSREAREASGKETAWGSTTIDFAHAVLPHYMDLDWLADKMIQDTALSATEAEKERSGKAYAMFRWPESLMVTSLYIVGLLGISCWRFKAKDY